ncbi:MAG: AAA family ATPase [Pyrobaculum sp.]
MPGDKTEYKLFKIRITELAELGFVPDRALLIGAPGVGKTEYVKRLAKQEAERLKRQFVDLREAESLLNEIETHPEKYYIFIRLIAPHIMPEDISIPRFSHSDNSYVEFVPPKVIHILTLKNIAGVIFIDELTNVQREDQLSLFYSLILEKEIGWNIKISKDVKVIAAANDSEWSEIARSLPKPLINRLIIFYVDAPLIEEWIRYMDDVYGDTWDRLVAAYLSFYPEDFIKQPDNEFSAFPTPRSWTRLALLLPHVSNKKLRDAIVKGTVGYEVGAKFISISEEASRLTEIIERLKKDPMIFNELTTSQKILVIHHLATKYDEYINIIRHINDEYLIMLIMLIPQSRRLQFLAHNREIAHRVAHRIATIQ